MPKVLPSKFYQQCVSVDADGLPENPAALLSTAQVHIFRKGEPYFACSVCAKYKIHLHFPPESLACFQASQWRCYMCVSQQPRFVHKGETRRFAICEGGNVRLYCNGCGRYKPPSQWQRYDILKRRSKCGQCRSADVIASNARNRGTFCRKCGGNSKIAVCEWCALGVPPITARSIGDPRVPEEFMDVNFAFHTFGPPSKFAEM
jgi:hypothetical protein